MCRLVDSGLPTVKEGDFGQQALVQGSLTIFLMSKKIRKVGKRTLKYNSGKNKKKLLQLVKELIF
jgi:hypothetical protein